MFDRDFWSRWPHHGMYFDTAGGHGGTAGANFLFRGVVISMAISNRWPSH